MSLIPAIWKRAPKSITSGQIEEAIYASLPNKDAWVLAKWTRYVRPCQDHIWTIGEDGAEVAGVLADVVNVELERSVEKSLVMACTNLKFPLFLPITIRLHHS